MPVRGLPVEWEYCDDSAAAEVGGARRCSKRAPARPTPPAPHPFTSNAVLAVMRDALALVALGGVVSVREKPPMKCGSDD